MKAHFMIQNIMLMKHNIYKQPHLFGGIDWIHMCKDRNRLMNAFKINCS